MRSEVSSISLQTRSCAASNSPLTCFWSYHEPGTAWHNQVTEQETDDTADPELRQALAAARSQPGRRATGAHSPLYEWLWARYNGMAPELNPPRTPNWTALAKTFGALGVFDAKGQSPKPVTVRQTWAKVSRAKGTVVAGGVPRRRRGKNPAATAEPPAIQAQAPLPTPSQLPPGIQPAEPDPPEGRYQFRFAGGPKVWTKDEPKPE